MTQTVTIIGGGPAGMAAALFAARAGARTILLERNEKLGKKLYITGKGRCNVTNTAENPFASIPHNPRFLYAAFSFLNAAALRDLLARYGCPTKAERGGRVFPESDKASDVTKALERAMGEAGVEVRLNQRVASLAPLLANGPVVLATGGASYPSTGSTGDGYGLSAALGHQVLPPRPSLIPLITKEEWPRALQGLSLKNVQLSAKVGKKVRFEELGEMLFTHFGVSGPLVLSMSSHILDDDLQTLAVSLDMKPGLTHEQLDRRLLRDFETSPRKQLNSLLLELVPSRMADVLPLLCGIPGQKLACQLSREERQSLGRLLKSIPLTIAGYRPIAEAIVTRGGMDVSEVVPGTLMSKKVPGLFFAGEILDVDAHTGGYNLQIAFSTGALAGRSAARWMRPE